MKYAVSGWKWHISFLNYGISPYECPISSSSKAVKPPKCEPTSFPLIQIRLSLYIPLQRSFTRCPSQRAGMLKVRSYKASFPFSTSNPCMTHSPGTSILCLPLNVHVPASGTRSFSTCRGKGDRRGTTISACN